MKKHIFNVVFYLICFAMLTRSVYRLAFSVPPEPGTPGYKEFVIGTVMVSITVGLMVVIPNLILEYLMKD